MKMYVIIPIDDITDEMSYDSKHDLISQDGSKVVFRFDSNNEPSYFNSFTKLTRQEWYNKYYNTESVFWNGESPI